MFPAGNIFWQRNFPAGKQDWHLDLGSVDPFFKEACHDVDDLNITRAKGRERERVLRLMWARKTHELVIYDAFLGCHVEPAPSRQEVTATAGHWHNTVRTP